MSCGIYIVQATNAYNVTINEVGNSSASTCEFLISNRDTATATVRLTARYAATGAISAPFPQTLTSEWVELPVSTR